MTQRRTLATHLQCLDDICELGGIDGDGTLLLEPLQDVVPLEAARACVGVVDELGKGSREVCFEVSLLLAGSGVDQVLRNARQ